MQQSLCSHFAGDWNQQAKNLASKCRNSCKTSRRPFLYEVIYKGAKLLRMHLARLAFTLEEMQTILKCPRFLLRASRIQEQLCSTVVPFKRHGSMKIENTSALFFTYPKKRSFEAKRCCQECKKWRELAAPGLRVRAVHSYRLPPFYIHFGAISIMA